LRYEDLIQTVSEVVENDKIHKDGLILIYELEEKRHKEMDEHLYYKANPEGGAFEHRDEVEVEIGGVTIRFVKKPAVKAQV
jgi:hypothetical protein